jgi:hypothetical protein
MKVALRIMLSIGRKLVQHVLPGVFKPIHILWNQLIAFTFFVLAVAVVPSAYRTIRDFDGEPRSLFRAGVSCTFGLIMIYFSLSSFLKARRISKS